MVEGREKVGVKEELILFKDVVLRCARDVWGVRRIAVGLGQRREGGVSEGRNFLLYGDRKRVEVLTGEESVNGKIGLRGEGDEGC